MRRRGFTIIELSFVLVVMALIIVVTVPAYEAVVFRARSEEARTMLAAIAHAELRHYRDQGAYLACASAGEVPTQPARFPEAACWKALGIGTSGEVRYRYRVDLAADSFTVVAEGDLDGDGQRSEFRWDGRTQALSEKDALE